MRALSFLRDAWRFLSAMRRHGVIFVTSSALAAAVWIWEHYTERTLHIPPRWAAAVITGGFLWATFKAWREERKRADVAEQDREALRSLSSNSARGNTDRVQRRRDTAQRATSLISDIHDRAHRMKEMFRFNARVAASATPNWAAPIFNGGGGFVIDVDEQVAANRRLLGVIAEAALIFDAPLVEKLREFSNAAGDIGNKARLEEVDAAYNRLDCAATDTNECLREAYRALE